MKIVLEHFTDPRKELPYEIFTFSGGEEHIRLDVDTIPILEEVKSVLIHARLTNSKAIMQVVMAVSALRNLLGYACPISLNCAYFPYARQDRVCAPGEAYGAKAMTGIINSLELDHVYITDPHSDITKSLLNRPIVMPQDLLFVLHPNPLYRTFDMVVAPDKGARHKAAKVQQALGIPELIHANKARDVNTGKITGVYITGNVKGMNILIPDDICDGGRTFTGLAELLKAQGAASITLFVTHGIFSKGFKIFEGLVDHIITTNSFKPSTEYVNDSTVDLTVYKLQGMEDE